MGMENFRQGNAVVPFGGIAKRCTSHKARDDNISRFNLVIGIALANKACALRTSATKWSNRFSASSMYGTDTLEFTETHDQDGILHPSGLG